MSVEHIDGERWRAERILLDEQEPTAMADVLKTMNDEDLRAMIAGIARCAAPWSADMFGMSRDAIDALGDELLRRGCGPGGAESPGPGAA